MQMFKQYMVRCSTLLATATAVLMSIPAQSVDLNLSQSPLYLSPAVAPLNMLVVGRDHKLYYEAYNDASDLDGDGKIDFGYKGYLPNPPAGRGIDYYGYFDSYKCYTYSDPLFTPSRTTATKRCGGADEWSGDYLNYLTMSRIDALRKVLYGGKRAVDTAEATVLIRSHIPMDAHSWGKEFSPNDPFDIRQFTPYPAPAAGTRHLFANTTPNNSDNQWYNNNGPPRLRVLRDSPYRIWEWVSKESPVAGNTVAPPAGEQSVTFSAEFQVRVAACVSAALIGNENCQRYPSGNYKPVGLLHEFGENNSMLFGLLTGSYTANKSGGVLRKNMSSITDEIDPTNGRLTDVNGIIRTLDGLRVAAYTRYTSAGGTRYDCGLPEMARGAPVDGTCRMWGNPVAEMMYETLRYFRGMTPTPAFTAVYGPNNVDVETRLNLPRPGWENPYTNRPVCAKPFQTVMADINNSYDSDQLPGSAFDLEVGSGQIENELPGIDVAALAQEITNGETGIAGMRFIGESGGVYDGAPTPKNVTSLANIRGLAPEEPTKQGSYYAASVAYHGFKTDISRVEGEQKVQTFGVALASPLPKIEIPVGGRTITLVPFAKSVAYGSDINRTEGRFQPTNQIVDFYVEALAEDRTSGTFQVNFEDVEAGNDHDMDAIVRYSYQVSGNSVIVNVSSDYQAGGIVHHLGYVISGTTADGVYLVVQDCNRGTNGTYACNGTDPDYFLDTPVGFAPKERPFDSQPLPGFSTRTFTPGGGTNATLLRDPLWYAAKWGGFRDTDGSGTPNLRSEWDNDPLGTSGYDLPDNYFLVTNALTLSTQLRTAFNEILTRSASASSAAVNSGSISTSTRIYQARFDTRDWTGELLAFGVNPQTGLVTRPEVWEASRVLPAPDDRKIITVNGDGLTGVPFRWASLDVTRKNQLSTTDATGQVYLNYLRGDITKEVRSESPTANPRYGLRNRPASRLGDIVSSAPLYVGVPRARYRDNLESVPYSTFVNSKRSRNALVYVGANDGMLHGFDAGEPIDTDNDGVGDAIDPNRGVEVFSFIPKSVFKNLPDLVRPGYNHRYYVDGSPNSADVFYAGAWHTVLAGGLNQGGQGVYALDITDPSAISEATARNTFLWEFTDENDRDLGFTYSQPAIVRLRDGTWAAVFGNGYNNTVNDGAATTSTTGNGVLYIVNIATGVARKFDTGVGIEDDPTGAGRPNGLATPTMVDVDGDRVVDHAYVGDLFGNLWKLDLRSANPQEWGFAFGTPAAPLPFFTATYTKTGGQVVVQPITARPEVARGPFGAGVVVLFGTGKFLEPLDRQITPRMDQSFYGLIDRNTYRATDRITSRSALVAQTITSERDIDPDNDPATDNSFAARTTSNNALMGSGWYLDLVSPNGYEGERAVTNPLVRDDRVIFTTLIPTNEVCNAGGRSWLMVLDLLSGSRLPEAQLDTNGDNKVDGDDQLISGTRTDDYTSGAAGQSCLTTECLSDRITTSTTKGDLDQKALRSIGGARGRQSWRQIR